MTPNEKSSGLHSTTPPALPEAPARTAAKVKRSPEESARSALQRFLVRAFVAVARLREEQAREALAAARRPL